MSETIKVDIISFLTKGGFQILRITENENSVDELTKYSWWMVETFEPSKATGMESVDFALIKGFEITDFLNHQRAIQQEGHFLDSFQNYLEMDSTRKMTMKYSPQFKWKLYTN